MYEILKDPNFYVSIIPVFIAVVTLIATFYQIHLSNKHKLFDRRLNNYMTFMTLFQAYEENKNNYIPPSSDSPIDAMEKQFRFIQLTSNAYLESISSTIEKPNLEENGHIFTSKMSELSRIEEEMSLIFPNKIRKHICPFIRAYKALLLELYSYQLEVLTVAFPQDENQQRKNIIQDYKILENAYNAIKQDETVKKLFDTIRL